MRITLAILALVMLFAIATAFRARTKTTQVEKNQPECWTGFYGIPEYNCVGQEQCERIGSWCWEYCNDACNGFPSPY